MKHLAVKSVFRASAVNREVINAFFQGQARIAVVGIQTGCLASTAADEVLV